MLRAHSKFVLIVVSTALFLPARSAPTIAKPKVRAITAFIRIDRTHPEVQVQEALTVLRDAKRSYEQRGYEVETIRITTQPFPDVIRGLSSEQAMEFFHAFDAFAKRESFLPNI